MNASNPFSFVVPSLFHFCLWIPRHAVLFSLERLVSQLVLSNFSNVELPSVQIAPFIFKPLILFPSFLHYSLALVNLEWRKRYWNGTLTSERWQKFLTVDAIFGNQRLNESIVFYQSRSAETHELKSWLICRFFSFATCIMPKPIDSLSKFRYVYI